MKGFYGNQNWYIHGVSEKTHFWNLSYFSSVQIVRSFAIIRAEGVEAISSGFEGMWFCAMNASYIPSGHSVLAKVRVHAPEMAVPTALNWPIYF